MERILRSALRLNPATAVRPRTLLRYAWYGSGIFCSYLYFRDNYYIMELADGPSMYPTIGQRGEYLVISRHYQHGRDVKVGDVVRFRHPTFLDMQAAKRVMGMPGDFVCSDPPLSPDVGMTPDMIQVPEGHAYVCGDNLPWSRDSRSYGPIPLGLVNGKVVARVWPLWKMGWVRNSLQPAQEDE